MKKRNFFKCLLVLLGLSVSNAQAFLTNEEIEGAKGLAIAPTKFDLDNQWLTLEKFDFEYNGKAQTFWMANGYGTNSHWGEIAIYPDNVDLKTIRYVAGEFRDLNKGAMFLSTLKYEYISGEKPHIVLEKVDAGYQGGGKGYSQACVKYFLDEFVSKKTDITHVFSDCRNNVCKHYFPKYVFKSGKLPGYTFQRGMPCPYYWMKEEEKK